MIKGSIDESLHVTHVIQELSKGAARVRKHRETHDLRTLTVDIPRDVYKAFHDYLKFKDTTKNLVITKLIRDQLLRKR